MGSTNQSRACLSPSDPSSSDLAAPGLTQSELMPEIPQIPCEDTMEMQPPPNTSFRLSVCLPAYVLQDISALHSDQGSRPS